jgi:hypothetical protein
MLHIEILAINFNICNVFKNIISSPYGMADMIFRLKAGET